jgi:hypothetical protein
MLRIQERLPASWGEQLAAITATYERALPPRCVGYERRRERMRTPRHPRPSSGHRRLAVVRRDDLQLRLDDAAAAAPRAASTLRPERVLLDPGMMLDHWDPTDEVR